jgi:hypothetical protein
MEKLTFIELAKRILEEEKNHYLQLIFGRLPNKKAMIHFFIVRGKLHRSIIPCKNK